MKVNMGIPQFTGGVLAYVGTPPEIINRPLVFHGHPYRATCVSMGNPNCVIHLDEISKEKGNGIRTLCGKCILFSKPD